jgi:hypothetical protein
MSLTTRVGLLAGATAMTLTGVGAAATTDTTTEELRAHVQQLTARVAELEGKGGNWLSEQRANEVRNLVHDVLSDADTRASLLGSGMTAGYDNGFTVGSGDGNFLLRVNGQLQARWVYSYQSDNGADGDRHRSGFENTRTKLWFSGHVVNPQWQYVIEGNFNRNDGLFDLLDAYITYDYGNGMGITVGQFKLPLFCEQLVDARYLQTVERLLVHELFTGGRSQGIMFTWEQDMFRFAGAFSDGAGNAGTPWNLAPAAGSTEWAFTARGEVLLGGTWGQFEEFRSAPGEEMGILIGAAAHWQDGEYGDAFPFETEVLRLTVDATAKFGGFNLFGAYIFDHTDPNMGGNFQNHAIVVQGGFHFTDEFEVFGRYEHVWFDSDIAGDDLSIITAGVNYYWAGHQAKFTADIGYGINEVNVMGASRTGWRNDAGTDDGQIVVRGQVQLLF